MLPLSPPSPTSPQIAQSPHDSGTPRSTQSYNSDYSNASNAPLLTLTQEDSSNGRYGNLIPRRNITINGPSAKNKDNGLGGSSSGSPSKGKRIRCILSRRERLMFVMGCASTLLVILGGQLLLKSSSSSNRGGDIAAVKGIEGQEYHAAVRDSDVSDATSIAMEGNVKSNDRAAAPGTTWVTPAPPNEVKPVSILPSPRVPKPTEDPNSDRSLLKPIFGSSRAYRKFLSDRRARFDDMRANDPECCRHPDFFDFDRTYYNLTEGSYAQEWSDERVKSHFRRRRRESMKKNKETLAKKKAKYLTPRGWDDAKKKWIAAWVRVGNRSVFVNTTAVATPSKARLKALRAKPKPRSMTFVHVGKAGGSTVLCNIREAFRYGKVHCPGYHHRNHLKYAFDARNDSAISKRTSCYVHYDERMYCYDNPTFLVNVRNPIHRLASWYLYEHRDNWDVAVDHVLFPNRPKHCGQQMLFACYASLDDLATVGLAGTRPSEGELLRIGRDLSEYDCRHWAWSAVQGRVPASFHNSLNYEWYLQYLLDKKAEADNTESPDSSSKIEIFVLRIEHLDDDWSKLDGMLGGTGATLPTERSHANEASDKPLPISNKTVGTGGIANLCKALCREIQVYKQILRLAENLDRKQRSDSLKEIREMCPEERSLNPRECE